MRNRKQLSILGCGWLGFPLAQQLIREGYAVKGSVRKKQDADKLKQSNINPYILNVGSEKIVGDLSGFLKDSETLIISIPPGLRKNPEDSFVQKTKNLLPFIEQSRVKKVLFISSTSVYGNDETVVTEETVPKPETESGKQLVEVECLLKNNAHFKTTVLRFGGLIGSDRHPVNYLAGKKNLKDPEAPINLIHLEDCINIIRIILKKKCWDDIFNGVAPNHPTREEYYTRVAKTVGLKPPQFQQDSSSTGKTVNSDKIENVLKYRFLRTI